MMLDKQKLLVRGEVDEAIVDTVLGIRNYVDSTTSLAMIAADLSSVEAAIYKTFDDYDQRPFGALYYLKLEIEDALESSANEPSTEREELSHALMLLSELCVGDTITPKKRLGSVIDEFIASTQSFLKLPAAQDKVLRNEKKLLFACYTTFKVIWLTLGDFPWLYKKIASSLYAVNVEVLLEQSVRLLHLIEARVKELGDGEVAQYSSIQEFFYARFLDGLQQHQEVSGLVHSMGKVINQLQKVTDKKAQKEQLIDNRKKIEGLLRIFLENDLKRSGRRYFVDLINQNQQAFACLMSASSGIKKQLLEGILYQLQYPSVFQHMSLVILYCLSWLASFIVIVYRLITPQVIQDWMAPLLPQTIDSQGKLMLKTVARECLTDLNQQLNSINESIEQFSDALAKGNSQIKSLAINESVVGLKELVQRNTAVKKAVSQYHQASIIVRDVQQVQQMIDVLDRFINKYQGRKLRWFNSSNPQSLALKKSQMIDFACVVRKELDQIKNGYQRKLAADLNTMEQIDDVLLEQLKKIEPQHKTASNALVEGSLKEQARLIINQSSVIIETHKSALARVSPKKEQEESGQHLDLVHSL